MEGLLWAEPLATGAKPPHKNKGLRGSRAQGVAYEHRVGRLLSRRFDDPDTIVHSGLWIRFEDVNGPGWAQPDHLVVTPDLLWIIECKLTHRPGGAEDQLLFLYNALGEMLWPGLPQILVECCHNLGMGNGGVIPPTIHNLEDALEFDREIYLWHYL